MSLTVQSVHSFYSPKNPRVYPTSVGGPCASTGKGAGVGTSPAMHVCAYTHENFNGCKSGEPVACTAACSPALEQLVNTKLSSLFFQDMTKQITAILITCYVNRTPLRESRLRLISSQLIIVQHELSNAARL